MMAYIVVKVVVSEKKIFKIIYLLFCFENHNYEARWFADLNCLLDVCLYIIIKHHFQTSSSFSRPLSTCVVQ